MNNVHIVANVDENLFNKTHQDWISSVSKNKGDCSPFIVTMGFDLEESINSVSVDTSKLKYSVHNHLESKKRKQFICLESGEFLDTIHFKNDDDVVILTDWDVTMQRPFTDFEMEFIRNLGDTFGVAKDSYSKAGTSLKESGKTDEGYLGINRIFSDVEEGWTVYNTGVQIANVRTWKKFYKIWKSLYPRVSKECTHHAMGQMLFNYIVHKYSMVTEIPPTLHGGTWFENSPAKVTKTEIGRQLTCNKTVVVFNHHKFINRNRTNY